MNFNPIHTKILEKKRISDFTIIRENPYNYPEGESNIYAKNSFGKIIWHAELPFVDDYYTNPIQWNKTLNKDSQNWFELFGESITSFVSSSKKGVTVCIDYRNGKILQSEFTK